MNAPYGFCPHCGEPGVFRARRLHGNDRCAAGHMYPSEKAIDAPGSSPRQANYSPDSPPEKGEKIPNVPSRSAIVENFEYALAASDASTAHAPPVRVKAVYNAPVEIELPDGGLWTLTIRESGTLFVAVDRH